VRERDLLLVTRDAADGLISAARSETARSGRDNGDAGE